MEVYLQLFHMRPHTTERSPELEEACAKHLHREAWGHSCSCQRIILHTTGHLAEPHQPTTCQRAVLAALSPRVLPRAVLGQLAWPLRAETSCQSRGHPCLLQVILPFSQETAGLQNGTALAGCSVSGSVAAASINSTTSKPGPSYFAAPDISTIPGRPLFPPAASVQQSSAGAWPVPMHVLHISCSGSGRERL